MARFALPVELGVGAVEHIEIDLAERPARLDDQLPEAAIALAVGVHRHGFGVREERMAFLDGRFLLAKKELRGAQPERVLAAVQYVAQDDVRHLLDEERRRIHGPAEEAHVATLHCPRFE